MGHKQALWGYVHMSMCGDYAGCDGRKCARGEAATHPLAEGKDANATYQEISPLSRVQPRLASAGRGHGEDVHLGPRASRSHQAAQEPHTRLAATSSR